MAQHATPARISEFLDATLGIPAFPDYEHAFNGLQVEARTTVRRVGAAVDASVASITAAVERGVDLLIVHHGIYWDGMPPVTGRRYDRVAPLIRAGAALYSAHLPLDAHPELGNAVQLARGLGLEVRERFGQFADIRVGFVARTDEERDGFRDRVAELVGGPVRLIGGGPRRIRRVGVVTGGGGKFVAEAAEQGLDTLLTGEASHHTYIDAHELGINVVLAGHYATETFGVLALAKTVEDRFGIPWGFLDFPSGL
ncbi:MAG: Nif3-like dinuclear metal center hexameric protein [Gammaproteobacteria bacterium]|nr:Nif3-like dinuclear metal center hexameric protein [Gammaproteobacteria bacterium]